MFHTLIRFLTFVQLLKFVYLVSVLNDRNDANECSLCCNTYTVLDIYSKTRALRTYNIGHQKLNNGNFRFQFTWKS
jgi:hypothetical protein